jgi:hypothetical protein
MAPYYGPYWDFQYQQYQNYLQWQQYLQYLQQYDPYYDLHLTHYQLYLQPYQPYQIYQPAATRWVVPSLHGQGRLLQLSFRGPKEPSVHCHGGPVHRERLSEGERVGGDVQLCWTQIQRTR